MGTEPAERWMGAVDPTVEAGTGAHAPFVPDDLLAAMAEELAARAEWDAPTPTIGVGNASATVNPGDGPLHDGTGGQGPVIHPDGVSANGVSANGVSANGVSANGVLAGGATPSGTALGWRPPADTCAPRWTPPPGSTIGLMVAHFPDHRGERAPAPAPPETVAVEAPFPFEALDAAWWDAARRVVELHGPLGTTLRAGSPLPGLLRRHVNELVLAALLIGILVGAALAML